MKFLPFVVIALIAVVIWILRSKGRSQGNLGGDSRSHDAGSADVHFTPHSNSSGSDECGSDGDCGGGGD